MTTRNLPRTVTLPTGQRPPVLEGTDLITGIREYGQDVEHPLLITKVVHTLGTSPSCDIHIESEYVSALHCVLDRRGQRVRVTDQSTRNGTFFRGRRETTFDVGPGDTFMVASTRLLAVDDDMRIVRPVLAQVLGYDIHALVDDAVVAAVQDGPLLVVGPQGAGQDRLVRAIHEASLRRKRMLIEVPMLPEIREEQEQLLSAAKRGTFAFHVTGARLDEAFLEMLMSPDHHIRLLGVAPSVDAALRSLGPEALMRVERIDIRRLGERRHEIGTLIDHILVENHLSLRMTDLTDENQGALRTHVWPGNLDELRQALAWIAEIVHEGSVRRAASGLDIPRSTLQYWLDRLGLSLPLTRAELASDAEPEPSSEP